MKNIPEHHRVFIISFKGKHVFGMSLQRLLRGYYLHIVILEQIHEMEFLRKVVFKIQ